MKDSKECQLLTSMNEGIVEIAITGSVVKEDFDKVQNKVFDIANTLNAKALLIDLRDLEIHFGYVDSYYLVRDYPPDILKKPIAIVDASDNEEKGSFHEIAARNIGLQLKWFTNIDEARAWIKSLLK